MLSVAVPASTFAWLYRILPVGPDRDGCITLAQLANIELPDLMAAAAPALAPAAPVTKTKARAPADPPAAAGPANTVVTHLLRLSLQKLLQERKKVLTG